MLDGVVAEQLPNMLSCYDYVGDVVQVYIYIYIYTYIYIYIYIV